jgi:molybdopterin synthase sulfur carrier subunit
MMMTVQLFGRFRDFHPDPELLVELPEVRTGADFRSAFDTWALAHWPGYNSSLLKACAIATESVLLHADSALPDDGRVAILPPVSGG